MVYQRQPGLHHPAGRARPGEAVDIDDYEVVTGISQDDYVLVTAPGSGFTHRPGPRRRRPADQLRHHRRRHRQPASSQELLFSQAGMEATAVPFDGGSPTLTAVLGGQVDVGSIQLGEAIEQIEAGTLTPIVTFAEERPSYLPDTPTAVEAGYDVPVQQSRAVVAPKGTPPEVLDGLRAAFQKAFAAEAYQQFNAEQPAHRPTRWTATSCASSGPAAWRTTAAWSSSTASTSAASSELGTATTPTGEPGGARPPAPDIDDHSAAVPSDVAGLAEAVHELEASRARPAAAPPGRSPTSSPRLVVAARRGRLVGSLALGVGSARAPRHRHLAAAGQRGAGGPVGRARASMARQHPRRRAVHPVDLAGARRPGDHGRLRRRRRRDRLRDPGGAADVRLAALPRRRELAAVGRHQPRGRSSRST